MRAAPWTVTYLGGPTAILEIDGLRFITDPTLDPAGTRYPTPVYTLEKTQSPALASTDVGPIDAVLLSHDHHFDNLDIAGRTLLDRAGHVITTAAGAQRLGGKAVGLLPWATMDLATPAGTTLRITATPARHGPPNGDRGPVIGFVAQRLYEDEPALYFSGDTVWFEGVAKIGERFALGPVLLNLGAARVAVAGPSPLTFTAAEAVRLAQAWPAVTVMPLHYEGWTHFSEGRAEIAAAFAAAGLSERIAWLAPGLPTSLAP